MKNNKNVKAIIAISIHQVIANGIKKQKDIIEKFQKDGLCTTEGCTEKGKSTSNGILCEKHFNEVEALLKELSKDPGFFKISVKS